MRSCVGMQGRCPRVHVVCVSSLNTETSAGHPYRHLRPTRLMRLHPNNLTKQAVKRERMIKGS